ncbi:hypothetical protein CNMCM8686_001662 [Aspergillus fumigatus]|nr:hypothetical protein CNMCM8686_001662 [Aspergillus fumigatus]
MDVDLAAGHAPQRLGGLLQHRQAASAQMHGGAQRRQLAGHGIAQAGAAAGDQDALAQEQVGAEHGLPHGVSPWFFSEYPRTLAATILQDG